MKIQWQEANEGTPVQWQEANEVTKEFLVVDFK
jgi:hypothetical protein